MFEIIKDMLNQLKDVTPEDFEKINLQYMETS